MVLRCVFFHLSRVAEDGNYYRPQRYKNADALYAFKSRGFGGEIGLSDSLGFTLSHELVKICI